MYKLSKYESLLQPVSDETFKEAQEKLAKNMKRQGFYRENQFAIFENETISSNFSGQNLRRSYYKKSKIEKANLTDVGFSGSVFISTDFNDCIINNTKLDFCEFDDCAFKAIENKATMYLNFNSSTLCNSTFDNLNLQAANFTNAIFENTSFKDCEWNALCLEGAVLKNTFLDNVKLKNLNFEFSCFDNIKLNNVRLPFPTIPYIFNGLTYLMNTQDSVVISSAASENGYISIDEYLNYINDLITFYTKTQNYFPLANIFIAQNKYDQAYAAILSGIKFTMVYLRNFRLVHYYCKLLHFTKHFTPTQRAYVYNMIVEFSALDNWRPIDYYNFSQYINKIRNTLLNDHSGNFLALTLNTNILSTEYNKISCLYQIIEESLNIVEKETGSKIVHYIEIRHNSPYEFFVKAFSEPDVLSLFLDVVKIACIGIEKLVSWKKEKKREEKNNELQAVETDLKTAQLQYYELQNEQLILQNRILRKQLDTLNANICRNDIVINNVNYYISNSDL